MRNAFSLVELSIVLVILGLLTGGILAGQSLIRAAELRSVTTEFNNYQTAVRTFQDKYFALPGDMRNATAFWGDNNTACADAAITNGSPGTCNGDADGGVDAAAGATSTGEVFQFWNQLALAGLIEGSYTGISGAAGSNDHDLGTNSPSGKLGQSSWGVGYLAVAQSASTTYFDGTYGNNLILGAPAVATSNGRNNQPLVVPEEMWNIDTKIDDGTPANGKVTVRSRVNCTLRADGSVMTSDAAGAADLGALYNLPETDTVCALSFRHVF